MPLPRHLRALASIFVAALPLTALPAQSPPAGFVYETLTVSGLDSATAMAFLPDGRLLLTERTTGKIRVFADGQLQPTPWATVPVNPGPPIYSESGLLGIAVDPGFLTNGFVYVFYTDANDENRIARLQEVNGFGTGIKVLTPQGAIPAMLYHNSGSMIFGTDGSLFVATGDGMTASTATNLADWRGKILRFEVPALTIPASNPFPNSPVWSFGHRNHFGLAVHPLSGDLYQTENGGGLMDELNRIVPGGNYGWPAVEGTENTPNASLVDPLAVYAPTIAPTGTCFYSGPHYPQLYRNAWFFTDYNWGRVQVLYLDSSGTLVVGQDVFDDHPGAGFAVATGPDGNLWFLTSDSSGYGGDEIGRYTHTNERLPSLHAMSVSNKTLGGSLTVGVHEAAGSIAIAWMSLATLHTPVTTPFGDVWVPLDVPSPAFFLGNDDRGYYAWSVPNDPTLLNLTIHLQGASLSVNGLQVTNKTTLLVRG